MRTPRKVFDRAWSNGAHEACLQAGPEDACPNCERIMKESFDYFYGHLVFGPQIAAAIFHDLQLQDMGVEG